MPYSNRLIFLQLNNLCCREEWPVVVAFNQALSKSTIGSSLGSGSA